jgi:hypothetical protein
MSRFEAFWKAWPPNGKPPFDNYRRKTNPKGCEKVWNVKKLDQHADEIIRDVQQRALYDAQWLENKGQFMQGPHPYLNQENWRVPFADARDQKKPRGKTSQPQTFNSGPDCSRFARYANRVLLNRIMACGGIEDDVKLARIVKAKNSVVLQAESDEWTDEDFMSVILKTISDELKRGTSQVDSQAA